MVSCPPEGPWWSPGSAALGRGGGAVLAGVLTLILAAVGSLTIAGGPAVAGGAGKERVVAGAPLVCVVEDPGAVVVTDGLLEGFTAAAGRGGPVSVRFQGGALTAGTGLGDGRAYPDQIRRRLAMAQPGLRLDMTVSGSPGEPLQSIAVDLMRAVQGKRPTLVVWEIGSADPIEGTDIDDFATVLHDTVEALLALGIDVMLIAPQPAGLGTLVIGAEPYVQAALEIGMASNVIVIDRGNIREDLPGIDGLEDPVQVHACLGAAVADVLLARIAGDR